MVYTEEEAIEKGFVAGDHSSITEKGNEDGEFLITREDITQEIAENLHHYLKSL